MTGVKSVSQTYNSPQQESRENIQAKTALNTELTIEPPVDEIEKKKLMQSLFFHGESEEKEIVWKDLKFYRKGLNNKFVVEVINGETGEVLKTISEPKFLEITENLSVKHGILIDVHG